jgi:hypothetical protein
MIGDDLFVCNFVITISDFLNTNLNSHLTNIGFFFLNTAMLLFVMFKRHKWFAEEFQR